MRYRDLAGLQLVDRRVLLGGKPVVLEIPAKVGRFGLVLGFDKNLPASPFIGNEILKKELIVSGVGRRVARSEIEHAAELSTRKTAGKRVYMKRYVPIKKGVDRRGIAGIFGVFRRDHTRCNQLLYVVVRMPFRCLYSIVYVFGVLYENR